MTSQSTASMPAVLTPAEMRRKALARLAERVDVTRNRHKPLSLVRAEGRRVVEAFLDQEVPGLPRPDRDRIADDVLAEAAGFGPLEEAFRDDAVKEILVAGPALVVGLKADGWTPLSGRFRDAAQLRQVLARWAEVGEPVSPTSPAAGGFDVKLGNGFRVVGVVPPAALDVAPQAVLVRGVAAAATAAVGSGPVRPFGPHTPAAGASSVVSRPAARPVPAAAPAPTPAPPPSTRLTAALAAPPAAAAPDPFVKVRQRVSERIVMKFAAAGVYDLNQIPAAELRRIIAAHAAEYCQQEKLGYDEAVYDRLALEILAAMNR